MVDIGSSGHCRKMPADAGVAAVVIYAAGMSTIFTFLLHLPGAYAAARTWTRERRRRKYRPPHAGLDSSSGPGRSMWANADWSGEGACDETA